MRSGSVVVGERRSGVVDESLASEEQSRESFLIFFNRSHMFICIAFLDVPDFLINVYIAEQVIVVGPGPLDEEGNRKPLSVSPGNTVMYSKYAWNEFKGKDGSDYIVLRSSDVMAVFSS
ncbi:hypothetical protein BVRB_6g145880 [Beta vulgaris subsp. vulgaris]|nr:hypothetical protein BVRB_6g145880 [Beta vulgaris subsp. vulgaris]